MIGLITKTETNPFFVKMKEGAEAEAKKLGAKLLSAAGKQDGDTAGQITAMENMVAAGAKTILITSSGDAIVPTIRKIKAQGVQVIALDSPVPEADALFATNNYKAGELIGAYAKAAAGRQEARHRHARPVPRPPGRRAAPQRLPRRLRPEVAAGREQRTRPARRSGVHGRQLR